MKSLTQSLLFTIGLTILPLATNAAEEKVSSAEYKLPTYTVEDLSLPVPSKIVAPRLRASQFGIEVEMIFTVTEKGKAKNIRSKSRFQDDPELVSALTKVIKKWEFEPARNNNGTAQSVKVSLPIKVLKGEDSSGTVAKLGVAKPTIIAETK